MSYAAIMKALALMVAVPLAACGGGQTHAISNSGGKGAGDYDRIMTFVPGSAGAIDKYEVPAAKASALIASLGPDVHRGDEGGTTKAYDFDADGTPDMVAFSEVMFGPSDGWNVFVRKGAALEQAFGISGAWADARDGGPSVAVRFQANVLAPGEARFSATLRYDRATKAWAPELKAYGATKGKLPAAGTALGLTPFTTAGTAVLRSDPVVNDTPRPSDESGVPEEDYEKTMTLRGNVLASYAAGAKGVVVATEGEWKYVAFDPSVAPKETSLHHGMDEGGLGSAWLCGWVKAAEIR